MDNLFSLYDKKRKVHLTRVTDKYKKLSIDEFVFDNNYFYLNRYYEFENKDDLVYNFSSENYCVYIGEINYKEKI